MARTCRFDVDDEQESQDRPIAGAIEADRPKARKCRMQGIRQKADRHRTVSAKVLKRIDVLDRSR
jgi:hypothetical protein